MNLRNPVFRAVLSLSLVTPAFASGLREIVSLADPAARCDQLYAKRGDAVFAAVECYRPLAAAATSDAETTRWYERIFIALSGVVSLSPGTDAEARAIDDGLAAVASLQSTQPNSGFFRYWRAVFTSLDAARKDRGAMIPRQTMKALKSIQADLNAAFESDPRTHGDGPARVLGVMHTQMPGIVGGNKALAERYLKEAQANSPRYSANWVAYAKILSVRGKDAEARALLKEFNAAPDERFDPFPGEPLRRLGPELASDRRAAADLLRVIDSE